jgi:opacity protein-like surface antigen/outer membrane protease
MLYPLIMCIAVIGLVHEAAAADMDTAYLRGSDAYGVTGPAYPAQQVAAPWYPTSSPAPSEPPVFKGPIAPAPPAWFWTGFYGGVHVGAVAGTANFTDPFGSSIFGDNITTPGFLAGGQIGLNWQAPNSNLVLGVEADASWLTSDGTNTCLAYSGLFVSANCRAQPNMMGDLTARVGWAYGQFNHSLFYVKGGAAFVHDQIDITTNGTPAFGLAPLTTSSSFTNVGWTVGAGAEHAITPAWSVKIEYDYIGLSGETVTTPQGLVQPIQGINGYNFTPAGTTRVTQNFQEINLGLNYKFGMDPSAGWGSASSAFPVKAPVAIVASGWEFAAGARDWYSGGKFQKDLGSTNNPAMANILNSRLTYDTTANSGELFGRIESPQNVFVKGNIGVGSLLSGQLNDEDWAIFGGTVAYSNTVSSVQGDIDYATLDLGYDFFRGAGYKLGAFVGYNYYRENKSAYGCAQIANPLSDCAPAIPGSVLAITEDDTWQSVRVGVNGNIMITDQLNLGADVAYLPYVAFNGTDDHVLRTLISPESGTGIGVQLESILSYMITDQFSVGVGGRYWAMWTTKNAITEFGGAPCPCQTQPATTDRYGVFVQLDYRGIGSLLDGFR